MFKDVPTEERFGEIADNLRKEWAGLEHVERPDLIEILKNIHESTLKNLKADEIEPLRTSAAVRNLDLAKLT